MKVRDRLPEYVSVQHAADLLDVSVSTIRRLIADREFPNIEKIRKVWRIPRTDLEAFHARNRTFHMER
jgi:excisionase family DNA binding protein